MSVPPPRIGDEVHFGEPMVVIGHLPGPHDQTVLRLIPSHLVRYVRVTNQGNVQNADGEYQWAN